MMTSGAFQTNSFLLIGQEECWLVDPGGPELFDCSPQGLRLRVFLTHGHVDHWAGLAALQRSQPGLRVDYPAGDAAMILQPDLQFLSWFGGEPIDERHAYPLFPPAEVRLEGHSFQVQAVPGHTPGHIALFGEGLLLAGDLLFQGGVGRTDFPGGSSAQLAESLQWCLSLPEGTVVCPGHGLLTTIGRERAMIEELLR